MLLKKNSVLLRYVYTACIFVLVLLFGFTMDFHAEKAHLKILLCKAALLVKNSGFASFGDELQNFKT